MSDVVPGHEEMASLYEDVLAIRKRLDAIQVTALGRLAYHERAGAIEADVAEMTEVAVALKGVAMVADNTANGIERRVDDIPRIMPEINQDMDEDEMFSILLRKMEFSKGEAFTYEDIEEHLRKNAAVLPGGRKKRQATIDAWMDEIGAIIDEGSQANGQTADVQRFREDGMVFFRVILRHIPGWVRPVEPTTDTPILPIETEPPVPEPVEPAAPPAKPVSRTRQTNRSSVKREKQPKPKAELNEEQKQTALEIMHVFLKEITKAQSGVRVSLTNKQIEARLTESGFWSKAKAKPVNRITLKLAEQEILRGVVSNSRAIKGKRYSFANDSILQLMRSRDGKALIAGYIESGERLVIEQ